jgi:hypothetical protein
MGQIFIVDGTAVINVTGRKVADQAFTCVGAGNFTVWMANGTTGTLSGTNVQGTPVALAAGLNTITTTGAVADGNIDITIGTAANTNSVNTYAASSGGQCGASITTSADNLYGDANSFTAGSQVLTVNATANFLNMDWTGATNNPDFQGGGQTKNCYGSITLIAAMTANMSGAIVYYSTSVGNTITTGGKGMPYTIFNGVGGSWIFQDDYTGAPGITGYILLTNGTVDTNGKTVTTPKFAYIGAGTRIITLGNSTVNCAEWDFSSGTNTLTANTATINCSGNAALGDVDYNGATLNLTGATSTVSGSPTGLAAFNLTAATTQTITFTAGQNITADAFTLDGSAGHVHTLTSTGQYTLTKAGGGTVAADYLSLTYCIGAPAATFYRKSNVTYGIGNSGWTPYGSTDTRWVDTSPLEASRRRITSGV